MRGRHVMPEGLRLITEAITPQTERELLAVMRPLPKEPMVMHGTPSRRLVCHFGRSYDAATFAIADAPDPPPLLVDVMLGVAALLGLDGERWEEYLVTHYPPGAGIGRHRDAPSFGLVAGLSLLSPCEMQFEEGSGAERRVWEQVLPPRSAYALTGPARWSWRHGIDAAKYERYSLTARTLRARAASSQSQRT